MDLLDGITSNLSYFQMNLLNNIENLFKEYIQNFLITYLDSKFDLLDNKFNNLKLKFQLENDLNNCFKELNQIKQNINDIKNQI